MSSKSIVVIDDPDTNGIFYIQYSLENTHTHYRRLAKTWEVLIGSDWIAVPGVEIPVEVRAAFIRRTDEIGPRRR